MPRSQRLVTLGVKATETCTGQSPMVESSRS